MTHDVGKLTGATGLLFVLVVEFHFLGRGLAIADLRRADFHWNAVFATNPFDVNLQVQFAHAGNQEFPGFLVCTDTESRIFLSESGECLAETVAIRSALWIHSDLNYRCGNKHAFQRAVLLRRSVRIAAGRIDSHDRHDIASAGLVDFFTLIRVHPQDAAKSFFADPCAD